ncbi:MAG: CBS domain-containing protein [Sinobacteraceae bacterium]|nr:CBS domain-containing protein [Nevskiaceae bacterium]
MTRSLITVTDDDTVESAMHVMTDNDISSVVVEPDHDGVWGILTRRDIVTKIVRTGRNPATTKVREVASRPVVSVPAEMSIREAANKVSESNYSRFTVAQGDRIIGIVTETDIFDAVEKFGWVGEAV